MIVIRKIFHTKNRILFTLLLSSSLAVAQRERPAQSPQDRPPVVYLAAESLPGTIAGLMKVNVSYSIPTNFFVFVRNTGINTIHAFIAQSEYTVEILDSNKSSVARDFLKKEIETDVPPSPRNENDFQTGIFSFNLLPGNYFLVFEAKDPDSKRLYRNDAKKIIVKDFFNTTMEISDMIFCQRDTAMLSRSLLPFYFGNDLPFGKRADCYVQLRTLVTAESLHVTYSISKFSTEETTPSVVIKDSVASSSLLPASVLNIEQHPAGYRYIESDTLLSNTKRARFHIASDTLEQGNYILELTARSGTIVKTFKQNFSIRWIGMPFSLRTLPVAVSAMEYLLPEDEFRQLRSADAETQKRKISAYWKKRDTTPGTAYNEMMEEYYRRVDYAFSTFSTLKEENGVKTERGKAYILYGPPSNIERKLLPSSAPREVWYYTGLRKKLTFVDNSRKGNYKLESSEDL